MQKFRVEDIDNPKVNRPLKKLPANQIDNEKFVNI